MVDRITHWHGIDYNGNHGTELYLDTGKSVRVACWPTDVERGIADTMATVHQVKRA